MPRRLILTFALLTGMHGGSALAQPIDAVNPAVDMPPAVGTQGAALPQSGGSDTIARLLEAIKPGVDTSIPPTPSQITDRIEALLNEGRNQEALTAIQARLADEESRHVPGTDVQLQFQHARALAALGRAAEAEAIYTELTTLYPELPEPWNNLASLYVEQGNIDRAHEALQMALVANPRYETAQANLADVQLMQALRQYEAAAAADVPGMRAKAEALRNVLNKGKNP